MFVPSIIEDHKRQTRREYQKMIDAIRAASAINVVLINALIA